MIQDNNAPRWTFDDLTPGRVIPLGSRTVTREEILAFAGRFDPQPMHLDEDAARGSLVGGLSASGFHTCGIMMRLMTDGYIGDSTMQGSPGVERISWPHPVHPGDTLTGTCHVLEGRLSKSRPGLGLVGCRHTLANQDGRLVLDMRGVALYLTREAAV